jgi:hypothetical protein
LFSNRHLRIALVTLTAASLAWSRGKGKLIDMRAVPKTVQSVSEALPRERRDATKRAALSLTLDDLLHQKPEVTDPKIYDELTAMLINDVLDKMCEPSEVFSTEHGPEKWNPRADFFFRETVKLFPGRASKEFHRKYTKRPAGKNIDRGYRNQPLTLDFSTATTEDDFAQWTDTKGWGAVIHEVRLDSGVARIGLTWVSPGTKEVPGAHFERPAWVAFYRQPKPGVGAFQLLAIEPETATDWREQPVNVVPPKTEPNDLERKLRLAVWMEDVRALPNRPAFRADEEHIFELDGEGDEKLEAAQLPMLEPYRDASSPMQRAAAELKIAALGGTAKLDNVQGALREVKHAAVKARLEELAKKLPPPDAEPAADAGK